MALLPSAARTYMVIREPKAAKYRMIIEQVSRGVVPCYHIPHCTTIRNSERRLYQKSERNSGIITTSLLYD